MLLLIIFFAGCDDDKPNPIELRNVEGTSLTILFDSETPAYSYALQGGDGNYMVLSENAEIVTAEMISSIDFRLEAKSIGETKVIITDGSQNILTLHVNITYLTHRFVVAAHDVYIDGDDLTGNEKKAIQQKQLAEIPVKPGGGYKFVFTDYENRSGEAIVYPEKYGSNGIETTFEERKISIDEANKITRPGYEIVINEEKRLLVLSNYHPSARFSMPVPVALFEDVTSKVQVEYPRAESVRTAQVIEMKR